MEAALIFRLSLTFTSNRCYNRSLTDVVPQILQCFLRVWRADISVLSQVMILYVYEKENGTDEIWCSCSPGIPTSLWRVLSPWLTKEIIFVCTVFLSFTLWMTCERTLIHAQFTLCIAPQNLQFTLWNSRLWSVYKRGRISCFDFMNIVFTIITIT